MRSRTTIPLFFAALALTAGFACGGPKATTDGPKGPDNAGGGSTDAAPGSTEDAGPTTTTTDGLGDAGSGQKLVQTDASSTASNAGASDGGRAQGDGGQPDPGRSGKDIEAIVKARRDEARKCYDDALKAHPGIEGDLVIQWTVDRDGKVTKIALNAARSTITEPSVVGCIIDIIKKIPFAPSPRGMESTYNYPYNFHPRGSR